MLWTQGQLLRYAHTSEHFRLHAGLIRTEITAMIHNPAQLTCTAFIRSRDQCARLQSFRNHASSLWISQFDASDVAMRLSMIVPECDRSDKSGKLLRKFVHGCDSQPGHPDSSLLSPCQPAHLSAHPCCSLLSPMDCAWLASAQPFAPFTSHFSDSPANHR